MAQRSQQALPKFNLPGEKPNWAMRIGVGAGVLLVGLLVALTAAIVHHRSLQEEAHVARIEAEAKTKADAEAKVAAAEAKARAAREADQQARAAKAALPATTVASAATAVPPAPSAPSGKVSRRHHGRPSKVAKGDAGKSDSKVAAKPAGKKKPDAIDELLSKMGK